jgi:protein tyrosine phosphatase (PTP) superfamily phosphohydrolase (DUF442 family)
VHLKIGSILLGILIASGMIIAQPSPTSQPGKAFAPVPGELGKHLHNAHIVTPRVISGAQPDDEAAFASLERLGVKTIISVDGAKPDSAMAKKYGMRYVHLPIGYDGVTEQRGREIAKAIDELPGPVYVHCHHGKHRSAAAVAVACVYNGQIAPDQAEAVLRTFGTGANYQGLWKAAREARPLDSKDLAGFRVEYVEAALIGDMAQAMVSIDHRWDHLKLSQAIQFAPPPEHPDINPPHEALQLTEHFHELSRLQEVADKPEDFKRMLKESEQASKALHLALSAKPIDLQAADTAYKSIAASCSACHKVYRD